jgi:hypothetical protein
MYACDWCMGVQFSLSDANPMWEQATVARLLWRGSLLPFGCEAVAKLLGPLRAPAGASSLATKALSPKHSSNDLDKHNFIRQTHALQKHLGH